MQIKMLLLLHSAELCAQIVGLSAARSFDLWNSHTEGERMGFFCTYVHMSIDYCAMEHMSRCFGPEDDQEVIERGLEAMRLPIKMVSKMSGVGYEDAGNCGLKVPKGAQIDA